MSGNHVVGLKSYFAVIVSLLALTVVTVWAAFQDFGYANTLVAMGIAVIKTLLVVAIFMHLKYAARINWVFAASGVIFLAVLIGFVVGDIKGRRMQVQAQPWDPPVAATAVHHP
jgi:cytochrome c oxidase subunit 4